MLSKLLKYENKALCRTLLPIYGLTLLLSLVNHFVLFSGGEVGGIAGVFQSTLLVAYIITVIAASMCTFILIIVRFYKSLLGDEGYLSFTLPVSTDKHIWAKLLSAAGWTILSILVTIASVLLLVLERFPWQEFIHGISRVFHTIWANIPHGNAIFLMVCLVLCCILALFSSMLSIYASASVGQVLIPKHRVLGGFCSYFILTLIMQIIVGMLGTWLPLNLMWTDVSSLVSFLNTFATSLLILQLLYNVALYFLTRFFLSRKLNLE